jgi:HPt (histidine-containing phosphotransfer) domain-containing protein
MIDLNHSSLDPYIEWSELDARVDGDHELIRELFELFQEVFPQTLADLKSAADRGEAKKVQLAAHTLKGMLANLSFKRGASLATNIEDTVHLGDAVIIADAVEAFEREMEPILSAVRSFTKGQPQ